jgi:diguanylate cyclase (GGDEF)-like protein/PAS domain S-box-containing protein
MTTGPARLHAYYARRRFHALIAAGIFSGFALVFFVFSVAGIGTGIPPIRTLLLAFVGNALVALLCYRRVPHAPTAFAWFWAVLIPCVMEGPSVNRTVDYSLVIPPVLGLMLGGWRSVVGTGVLSVLLMIARSGTLRDSPYAEPAFLLVHTMVVATLVVTQRAFVKAMKDDAKSTSLMDVISRASDDIILVRNAAEAGVAGKVRFVSPGIAKSLGYSVAEVIEGSSDFSSVVHVDDRAAFAALQKRAHHGGSAQDSLDFRVQHRAGHWVWMNAQVRDLLREPGVFGIVTTLREITKEREAQALHAHALEHRATHDELTGLPTRRKLTADLDAWVERRRTGEAVRLAVIFCDIDSFKHVNDGLGHGVGDELLRLLAENMQTALGDEASLYRFGGDEFVALVSGTTNEKVREIAQKLASLVRAPLLLKNHRLVVTMSVGVAHLESHVASDSLLRDADVAMYAAKEQGKNRIVVFDAAMQKRALRRHRLEQAMRSGISAGEFRTVFQPKVNTQTRGLVGFEALLRWRSPQLGDVSPAEFIPVAEETGLILELGQIALRQACEMIGRQNAETGKVVAVSVNVSIEQMLDSARFRSEVEGVFAATGASPRHVELEITESLLLKQEDLVVATLRDLKSFGLRLSVDDFGTGYSSLAYLRRFPIDTVKIDRTFVTNLAANQDNYAIVSAILSLARNLNLHTVAEGVETESELNAIASLGCDDVQGYLISRPLELEAALAFRREWTPPASSVGAIAVAAKVTLTKPLS